LVTMSLFNPFDNNALIMEMSECVFLV
jgi:hypothetical protein